MCSYYDVKFALFNKKTVEGESCFYTSSGRIYVITEKINDVVFKNCILRR